MKMVINAFNIRMGGGVTHLVELLSFAEPQQHGFSEVTIFSSENMLARIPEKPWLKKIAVPALGKNFLYRLWWNFFHFPRMVKNYDFLFVPGGTYFGKFRPFVNMFQNALPFEGKEKNRFFFTSPLFYIKWNLLKITQALTFKKTQGALFPSHYLKNIVSKKVRSRCFHRKVVPHGINPIFFNQPNIASEQLLEKKEIRLLYVSRIDFYKHQWNVVKAAQLLRDMKIPVRLDLCGYVGNKRALNRMNEAIKRADPNGSYIHYHGHLDYHSLPDLYKKIDIFVFASSCESISSILLEGMASGVAIACSKMPVAEEVIRDAGVYFDPEKPGDIKDAIHQLIVNQQLFNQCKEKAYHYAKEYSWKTCATDTFSFLKEIAQLKTENDK